MYVQGSGTPLASTKNQGRLEAVLNPNPKRERGRDTKHSLQPRLHVGLRYPVPRPLLVTLLSLTMLCLTANAQGNSQTRGGSSGNTDLKATLVGQLRTDFPSRRGVRLTQFGGMFADPEMKTLQTVIEVLPDSSRWRTIFGQNTQQGRNNYLVSENLISQSQMVQCSSFGRSSLAITEYVPDSNLKLLPAFFTGTMEDAGAGRLARLELLFGLIPNRKGLADLHSEKFARESKTEIGSETDLLIHVPSGVRFEFDKDHKLKSVTIPEYKVDSAGTFSPWFDWKFEPTDRRHDDGGVRGMNVTSSDGKHSGLVFDHVRIESLEQNATLQDFSIYKVKEGTRVSPIDKKLGRNSFVYSDGQAILRADGDAESEVESAQPEPIEDAMPRTERAILPILVVLSVLLILGWLYKRSLRKAAK